MVKPSVIERKLIVDRLNAPHEGRHLVRIGPCQFFNCSGAGDTYALCICRGNGLDASLTASFACPFACSHAGMAKSDHRGAPGAGLSRSGSLIPIVLSHIDRIASAVYTDYAGWVSKRGVWRHFNRRYDIAGLAFLWFYPQVLHGCSEQVSTAGIDLGI